MKDSAILVVRTAKGISIDFREYKIRGSSIDQEEMLMNLHAGQHIFQGCRQLSSMIATKELSSFVVQTNVNTTLRTSE